MLHNMKPFKRNLNLAIPKIIVFTHGKMILFL